MFYLIYFFLFIISSCTDINSRPIIGETEIRKYGPSYIPASYIKYVESSGGRVVPIPYDASEEELTHLFYSINGVLFPGGATSAKKLWAAYSVLIKLAIKANNNNDYFPILGICLGFEVMLSVQAQTTDILSSFDGSFYSIPLILTPLANSSRLLSQAPIDLLIKKNITVNHHHSGVAPSTFNDSPLLTSFYYILSLGYDPKGKIFISSFEGQKYPFYGLQFHPEKPIFEWRTDEPIPHSHAATLGNAYFGQFLINESYKSKHKFNDTEEEYKRLIYSYDVVRTDRDEPAFIQCYFFD